MTRRGWGVMVALVGAWGCSGGDAIGTAQDASSSADALALFDAPDAQSADAPDVQGSDAPDVQSTDATDAQGADTPDVQGVDAITDTGPVDAPCVGGTTRCGDRCVALRSDNEHCGACNNACAAGMRCEAGRCEASCASGLFACSGMCVDTNTSPANCGACGRTCPMTPNRPVVCVAGNCTQGACTEPYADCDTDFANGCEANLRSNPAHCGRCGTSCGSPRFGRGECTDGACTVLCDAGHGDCDGNRDNGCEADFQTDPRHCGGCGRACATGQGCRAGSCTSGAISCSAQAIATCTFFGGRAPTAAQDGRVVCVFGNVSTTDFCGQSCGSYRVFAWRDGAGFPACASTPGTMRRGTSYTGPATCGCDQPPRSCGAWDMGDCIGD